MILATNNNNENQIQIPIQIHIQIQIQMQIQIEIQIHSESVPMQRRRRLGLGCLSWEWQRLKIYERTNYKGIMISVGGVEHYLHPILSFLTISRPTFHVANCKRQCKFVLDLITLIDW